MTLPISAPLFDYESRIVSLLGRVESHQVDLVIDQLLRLDAESEEDITIFLSCRGGDVVEALKLTDTASLLRSHLTAVGLGLIEGAAVLLMATAHKRILFASAFISTGGLWELPYLHADAQNAIGLRHQVSICDELRNHLKERVRQLDASSRFDLELLLPDLSPRLFSATECVSLGLADSIVKGPARLLTNSPKRKHSHVRLSH